MHSVKKCIYLNQGLDFDPEVENNAINRKYLLGFILVLPGMEKMKAVALKENHN